jgi:hypothetical protein
MFDGPPPLIPQRVVAGISVLGRRVRVADRVTDSWVVMRVAGEPYWRDEQTGTRWHQRSDPPEGVSSYHELIVPLCSERDWFAARIEGRFPTAPGDYIEYPAWQVWTDD